MEEGDAEGGRGLVQRAQRLAAGLFLAAAQRARVGNDFAQEALSTEWESGLEPEEAGKEPAEGAEAAPSPSPVDCAKRDGAVAKVRERAGRVAAAAVQRVRGAAARVDAPGTADSVAAHAKAEFLYEAASRRPRKDAEGTAGEYLSQAEGARVPLRASSAQPKLAEAAAASVGPRRQSDHLSTLRRLLSNTTQAQAGAGAGADERYPLPHAHLSPPASAPAPAADRHLLHSIDEILEESVALRDPGRTAAAAAAGRRRLFTLLDDDGASGSGSRDEESPGEAAAGPAPFKEEEDEDEDYFQPDPPRVFTRGLEDYGEEQDQYIARRRCPSDKEFYRCRDFWVSTCRPPGTAAASPKDVEAWQRTCPTAPSQRLRGQELQRGREQRARCCDEEDRGEAREGEKMEQKEERAEEEIAARCCELPPAVARGPRALP